MSSQLLDNGDRSAAATAVILPPPEASFLRVAGLPMVQRAALAVLRAGFDTVVALGGAHADRLRALLQRDRRTAAIPVLSLDGLARRLATDWVVLVPADCLVTAMALRRVREGDDDAAAIVRFAPPAQTATPGIVRCRRELLPQSGSVLHGEPVGESAPGVPSPTLAEHLTTSPKPSPGRRGLEMCPLPRAVSPRVGLPSPALLAGEGEGEGSKRRIVGKPCGASVSSTDPSPAPSPRRIAGRGTPGDRTVWELPNRENRQLPQGEGQGEGVERRAKHAAPALDSQLESAVHEVRVVPLEAEECLPVFDQATARAAEECLIAQLRQATAETDGPIARFDRAVSTRISRHLVRTPLRPNHITTIGTVVGLLAAWCFARGTYAGGIVGAALFWCAVILDGCDGEVARLKFQESRWGGVYDVVTDNVVHAAIFFGLVTGCFRVGSAIPLATFALILLGGFACALLATYLCLIRHPPVKHLQPRSRRGRVRRRLLRGFEALMNRDFAYLLLALALIGHLSWFVWGAALGTYAYAAGLVTAYLWREGPA